MYDNFSFENVGTNTFLVYSISPEEEIDTMSLGMITNNKIPGFAETIYTQVNGAEFFKYNISAKVSMDNFLIGSVTKRKLVEIFKGIINAYIVADEYMVDPASILLDQRFIYSDVSTYETIVICLPVERGDNPGPDLCAFFKNIMFTTQSDPTENCDHVAKIINYLNSSTFSATDFRDLLNSILEGDAQAKKQGQPVVQPPMINTQSQSFTSNNSFESASAVTSSAQSTSVGGGFVSAPSNSQITQSPSVQTQPKPQPAQTNTVNNGQQNTSVGGMNIPSAKSNSQGFQTPPAKGNGFQTPPANGFTAPGGKQVNAQPIPAETGDEKEISLLYLLQHYNSENAAAYKAQKAKKKNKAGQPQNQNAAQAGANMGFNIPGQTGAAPVRPMSQPQSKPQPTPNQIPQMQIPAPNNPQQPAQNTAMQMPQQSAGFGQQQYSQQQSVPKPFSTPEFSQPQSISFTLGVQQGEIGGTTVLGGGFDQGTTVLGAPTVRAAQTVSPYLYRVKNNESIKINKEFFRIGKERSFVDYFIGDNPAVSRSHAIISINNGRYFIKDTNSTNHTYLNGNMIQSSCDIEIKNGDKIRLANEDFEFKVY